MYDALVIYKQVSLQFDEAGNLIISEDSPLIHTVSCDEKLEIQTISTISEDIQLSCDIGSDCVYHEHE